MKENKSTVKNELITLENYESRITNTSMRKNVGKILKAGNEINKNEWSLAIAINNIYVGEQFKDDFGTIENFCESMESIKNANYITRTVKAVNFMVNTLGKYDMDMSNTKWTKAYKLSVMSKDFDRFVDFCKTQGVDIKTAGVHKIEEMIKLYKHPEEEKEQKEVAEQSEVTEEQTEENKDEKTFTGNYDNAYVWFTIDGNDYVLPFSELKHYKV